MIIILSITFFIISIILPFINLAIYAKACITLNKNKAIRKFFSKEGNLCNNPPKLNDFRKKNVHIRIESHKWLTKSDKDSAKKAYSKFINTTILYGVLVILSIVTCIGTLFFNLLFIPDKPEIAVMFFLTNLPILWIFSLSVIFRNLGATLFADKVDTIIHEIFVDGKVYRFFSKTVLHGGTFIINLLICLILLMLTSWVLSLTCIDPVGESNGLVFMCTYFFVYRYVIIPIIAFFTCKVAGSFTKGRVSYSDCKEFVTEALNNSTYMVYLILYFVYKVETGTSISANIAEAIGIIFLLDTYIDKQKQINSKWNLALDNYAAKINVEKNQDY